MLRGRPGESNVDDGFDRNVNINGVVVHRRQILFVRAVVDKHNMTVSKAQITQLPEAYSYLQQLLVPSSLC